MGSTGAGRRVRFAQFEIDEKTGELRKDGTKIRLQEQPLQILRILLEHPGEVVAREELRKRVWPTDTFVDFDHGINNAIKRLREALSDSADIPKFVETVARRGYRFIERVESTRCDTEFLAVLPLENLSHDPEQEYFADGLTDSLITQLARISALRVVSRTTAMHYKRIHRPLPEIARELGVSKIVEGTVQRSGGRVRVCAQLVEASTDTHLWADSYERDLRDVLSLQSELARAIVKEVQVKLTPQEQAHLARADRVDREAYDAYLKGRYYFYQRRGDALRKGVQCFERAIEKDPTYAAAYAGLADCLSLLGWWAYVPPAEGCGKAREFARKAIQLDQSLGEAHGSLAWATVHYDYDFALAEKEYRTCIELNPQYATGHQWFGLFLTMTGRFEEGFQELKTGIGLDPFVPMINACLAWGYWLARRKDDHIEQLEKTLELDPNFAPVNWGLGLGYLEKGMYDPAIAEMQKAVQLSQRAPIFVALLGEAYAVAGRTEDAQKILDELKETAKQRYVTPYILARIYSALDEKDIAFHWLETAYREHAPWTPFMKSDPRLDSLRSDPRFMDLLRHMNFPD